MRVASVRAAHVVAGLLATAGIPSGAAGQDAKDRLVGSWSLSAYRIAWQGEAPRDLFGARPQGRLVVTPQGTMAMVIGAEGRTAARGGGDAERVALHRDMVAFTGRYRVEGDRLVTAVDMAWNKVWEGTEQARTIQFDGEDKLLLESRGVGVFDRPGAPWVANLVFERER